MKRLMIVVPAYNEEEALPKTLDVLDGVLSDLIETNKVDKASKIVIVNDGSADKTWSIIEDAAAKMTTFLVLILVVTMDTKMPLLLA
ncbi:Uncharacterized glycosyltransferase ykoT [Weissella viridescens]|uniref:Uncharacterized glycosyltransferase ykoT n=1 Tax=Weissella viridescens TaxID=1629 RepID=A0A380P3C2_WEIVI|nr:Uncharacterized glycosyltransferase ykoT [Weissella viridescens]